MRSIFLSYSFRDQDRDLVDDVDHLLASHGIPTVRGRRLGGQPLWSEIERRIKGTDGLVALMTRRDQLSNGDWDTHPWVLQEFAIARTNGRRTIAVIETGVPVPGAVSGFESLLLDRASPLSTFIALSETIGHWKLEAGRTVKVQILPEDLAREVGQGDGTFHCRYRLIRQSTFSDWEEVPPIPEPGGTFLFVNGVGDDHAIQIEIEGTQRRRWLSPVQSQWMEIRLQEAK
jgi:hypothetical protein